MVLFDGEGKLAMPNNCSYCDERKRLGGVRTEKDICSKYESLTT